MADKSKEQHEKDIEAGVKHYPGCLNSHERSTPAKGAGNTCCYRWQAYLKANGDRGMYNYDKYASLCAPGRSQVRTRCYGTDRFGNPKKVWPGNYSKNLDAPKPGDWDIGVNNNFWTTWTKPYWHEAHHIVPNGTLDWAISNVAKNSGIDGIDITIRKGLVEEKYNLNGKINMIILPQDEVISEALGLPIHTSSKFQRHGPFSTNVRMELEKIIGQIPQRVDQHKARKYDEIRQQIRELSRKLYKTIKRTTASELSRMSSGEFPRITG